MSKCVVCTVRESIVVYPYDPYVDHLGLHSTQNFCLCDECNREWIAKRFDILTAKVVITSTGEYLSRGNLPPPYDAQFWGVRNLNMRTSVKLN